MRDIILFFHDRAALDMILQNCKELRRKACGNDYDYLQIHKFAKKGEGRYTIGNCIKTTYGD